MKALRRFLLVIFLIGSIGIALELVLMEHTEGVWQWIPIVALGIGWGSLLTQTLCPRRGWIRVFQATMVVILLVAALGVWLHFDGKAEFKQEIDPDLQGWALVWECLHGHSLPPVLAPGSMMLVGLIGLALVFQHPVLTADKQNEITQKQR